MLNGEQIENGTITTTASEKNEKKKNCPKVNCEQRRENKWKKIENKD